MYENKEIISPLFTVPKDIVGEISSYLELKDLSSISRAYNKNNFFREQFVKAKDKIILDFFEFVAFGQQQRAEQLLHQYPKLSLVSFTITDYSGRIFEGITAFQYALWALDRHMWKMLKQFLTDDEAAKQLNDHVNGTKKYKKLHGTHYNFDRIIDVLKTYINMHSSWSDEERIIHWCTKVGGEQRLVPAHVANEYCRNDESFNAERTFKEATLPRDLSFLNTNLNFPQAWFPLAETLGFDLGITRGTQNSTQASGSNIMHNITLCQSELAALIKLKDTRTQEFTKLKDELLNPDQTKKQELNPIPSTPSKKSSRRCTIS